MILDGWEDGIYKEFDRRKGLEKMQIWCTYALNSQKYI